MCKLKIIWKYRNIENMQKRYKSEQTSRFQKALLLFYKKFGHVYCSSQMVFGLLRLTLIPQHLV